MRSIQRQRHSIFRTLLTAVLMLGVVLQPMIAMASAAHESQHMLMHGHSHEDGGHDVGIPDDEGMQSDEAASLHLLLHQGHCCVHGNAILVSVDTEFFALPPASLATQLSIPLILRFLPPIHRPPIQV
jgi:hypothetical protein